MDSKEKYITKPISLKLFDGNGMDFLKEIKFNINRHEKEIIEFLIKNNYLISPSLNYQIENPGTFKLTNNLNIIIKQFSLRISPDEDIEKTASICQSEVIGQILENLAIPTAITNSFDLNCSKSKEARDMLSKLIKGTSKISNTLGLPNLNTSVSINNPIPLINCAAIGIKRKNEQKTNETDKCHKIFFLGKLSDFDFHDKKSKTISAYHLKFIKDAMSELIDSKCIISVQHMGYQNMISSIASFAYKNGHGAKIELSKLLNLSPCKENYDFLQSEKTNSFLISVSKEGKLLETARKWELDCVEIGESTSEENLRISNKQELIADLPLDKIKEILSENQVEEYSNKNQKIKSQYINKIPMPKSLRDAAWYMIKHPNIASTNCLHSLYDSMAGTSNLNTNFKSDANLIKVKKTDMAVAICNSNSVISGIDPAKSIQIEISNTLRKIACSGAKINSMSINIKTQKNNTDEKFINELFIGATFSSEKFKFPFEINFDIAEEVINNNNQEELAYVSLITTGIVDNCNHQMTMSFKDKGNIIFLLGQSKDSLATSEYLKSFLKKEVAELPDYNPEIERKLQLTLLELTKLKLISSAHNVSKGGLFISLLESAMVFGLGFDIITDTDQRTDSFLFGELPGRVIVSVTPNKETRFIDYMINKEIPFLAIGHVTKGEMRIDDISYGFIDDAKEEYYSAFNKFLNKM